MKWNHLPVHGGLYDQDPDLLDKFEYMFHKIAEHENKKNEDDKRKADAERRKQEAKSPGRARRR